MKVSIKQWHMDLDVKTKGLEFEVRDNDGNHKGDCFLTKTGLIWCKGRTKRNNGISVSWDEFIEYMEDDG